MVGDTVAIRVHQDILGVRNRERRERERPHVDQGIREAKAVVQREVVAGFRDYVAPSMGTVVVSVGRDATDVLVGNVKNAVVVKCKAVIVVLTQRGS